jgi:hypothetical protein
MTIEPQPAPPEPTKITTELLDYIEGLYAGTVQPAGPVLIPVRELVEAARLGTAWMEAMALVPEGGRLDLGQNTAGKVGVRASGWPGFVDGQLMIVALIERDDPVEALQELIEKLRTEKLRTP